MNAMNYVTNSVHSFVNQLNYLIGRQANHPVVIKPPTLREMYTAVGNANLFLRLAGISGALAVGIGAYGSHTLLKQKDEPVREERNLKEVFKIANQYHFIHTLALLAVPFAGKPLLVGSLLLCGMTIFCGTCYNYSLRGDAKFNKITPYGGTLLIAAWLSFLL